MLFPTLWESGATNKSSSFLHTVCAGGKKVKRPRITGPTNLKTRERTDMTIWKRDIVDSEVEELKDTFK